MKEENHNTVTLKEHFNKRFDEINERVKLAKDAVDAKANIANIIAAIAAAGTLYSLLRK